MHTVNKVRPFSIFFLKNYVEVLPLNYRGMDIEYTNGLTERHSKVHIKRVHKLCIAGSICGNKNLFAVSYLPKAKNCL